MKSYPPILTQTPSFAWPTEFLVVVIVLFALAIGVPWLRIVRRLPLGRFFPVVCATGAWIAYEFYLRSIAQPGDPLIRVDLFLLIPLAVIAWLAALVAFALRRRGQLSTTIQSS